MANELKYHMNMLNSIDRQVGGPGNWTYIIDALNSIDQGLTSYIPDQRQEIEDFVEQVIASIPSDYTALEQATYNAYPTQSETGNPIYFDDGADSIPVKELIVNLEPKQSGTGDPSPTNVRAISGYDGVAIKRNGRNLFAGLAPQTWTSKGITHTVESDGTGSSNHIIITGTSTDANADSPNMIIRNSSGVATPIELKANNSYTISLYGVTSSPSIRVFLRTGTNANLWYGDSTTGTWTFTPTEDLTVERVMFRVRTSGSVCNINGYFQIEVGSTPTEYEPYTGQEYSITFPSEVGTVYGGTLNVTTGELVVDRTIRPYTANWNIDVANQRAYYKASAFYGADSDSEPDEKLLCSHLPTLSMNDVYQNKLQGIAMSTSGSMNIHITGITDQSSFTKADVQNWLNTNGVQICYKTKEPLTYQLTPTEVSTLLDSNTIQSDGSMELEYRADTTTVINKLKEA